jgi:hypothetical protein
MKRAERFFGCAAVLCAAALIGWLLVWGNYQGGKLLVKKSEGRWALLIQEVPTTPSLTDLLTKQGNYVYRCEVKFDGVSRTACTFNLGGSFRALGATAEFVADDPDAEKQFRFVFSDGRAVRCSYSAHAGADWRFE